MNPLEHQLQYPWTTVPPLGTITTLRPGLHWLRMGLPFALNHINLWLMDDELNGRSGFTLVDTGIASDETRTAWETLFDTVLGGLPILRVICTHFHPDHFGLAAWICEGGARHRWQARLWMTHGEYFIGRLLSQGKSGVVTEEKAGLGAAAHYRAHGLQDAKTLEQARMRDIMHYPRLVPAVPPTFHRIRGGDHIAIGLPGARRDFEVILGDGHAPEHAMLACTADRLLISGDIVLPRISTNVGVVEIEPEGNPLPAYLASLDRLRGLPADTLVLPSHGLPFLGLQQRIDQQHQHHAERLAEVLAACATPRSAAQIVPVLFPRELDFHQLSFAFGEAIAHLHMLWYGGQLRRLEAADGSLTFVAAGAA